MAKRKKDTAEVSKVDSNFWMVTFSDLIMLLLTFFVLLLSMSSMDTKKLKDIFTHFAQATGILEFSDLRSVTDLVPFVSEYNDTDSILVIDQDSILKSFQMLSKTDDKSKKATKLLSKKIRITDDERGVVLSFQEGILFDPGTVDIKKDVFPVLDSIARAIQASSNHILIMGHTDSTPIHGKLYKSNWELSAYRALSVLEYFLAEKGLSPLRFSAGGYGPSRPLYPNNSPANRALNRRVEIIFQRFL